MQTKLDDLGDDGCRIRDCRDPQLCWGEANQGEEEIYQN
jgi:hypothetical protein